MTDFTPQRFPNLFRGHWPTTGLATAISTIDMRELAQEYEYLREVAPSRSSRNKPYFVRHDGGLSGKNFSSRSEEHLAIALWHLDARWPSADRSSLRLLDYQFPLKASRSDTGLGKVDLLGATDEGRLAVIELKVRRKNGSRGDTPVLALMEGLRYAAVVEANHGAIASEAGDIFGITLADRPPIVQILAPENWWRGWRDMTARTRRASGHWEASLAELAVGLESRLGITVEWASLQGTDPTDITWDGRGPRLARRPTLKTVRLEVETVAGTAVDYVDYEQTLLQHLWAWADRRHSKEIDDGGRSGRPPVLRPEFASKGLLVPTDPSRARDVVSVIHRSHRHRWFRSLKSSQALAQSVFGAVHAFRRLDLLRDVPADCGRPAFLEDPRGASLNLEHEVRSLGEPRSTSVDAYIEAPSRRIAVECKFTEREFGVCSRPKLRPQDRTYAEQYCDGDYRVQRGRRERCALTEIGVRYWAYLPHLFDWKTDHDLRPCPFSEIYQLARNALAVTVTTGGCDPNAGHVLVVYDARNPEFAGSGTAQRQYEAAIAACRVPGLFRRLSWQRLAGALDAAPDLAYLVAGLQGKYGISPE